MHKIQGQNTSKRERKIPGTNTLENEFYDAKGWPVIHRNIERPKDISSGQIGQKQSTKTIQNCNRDAGGFR